MQDDLHDLDTALKSAQKETLDEIIRQAEVFLDAQLQSGIASDQRAITFASVVAAVVAVLLGGYWTAVPDNGGTNGLTWVLWPIGGLLLSACLAAIVARPTDWYYAGSNPRHWRKEVANGDKIEISLAGQAKLYAEGIKNNKAVLDLNAKLMSAALVVAGLALVVGLVAAIAASSLPTP